MYQAFLIERHLLKLYQLEPKLSTTTTRNKCRVSEWWKHCQFWVNYSFVWNELRTKVSSKAWQHLLNTCTVQLQTVTVISVKPCVHKSLSKTSWTNPFLSQKSHTGWIWHQQNQSIQVSWPPNPFQVVYLSSSNIILSISEDKIIGEMYKTPLNPTLYLLSRKKE